MHSSTGRLVRGAALLVAVAVTLTACGASSDSGAAASGNSSASAAATPSETVPVPEPLVAPAAVASATFSGPAVEQFGDEQVQAGYVVAAEFLDQTSFVEELLRHDPARTANAYDYATEYMTVSMAEQYRATVQGAFDGDEAEQERLGSLHYYSIDGSVDVDFRSSGPLVIDHVIDRAQAGVEPDGRLSMTVHETGTVRLLQYGNPVLLPLVKDVTFYLTPGGSNGRAWSIDGINASWRTLDVQQDESSS